MLSRLEKGGRGECPQPSSATLQWSCKGHTNRCCLQVQCELRHHICACNTFLTLDSTPLHLVCNRHNQPCSILAVCGFVGASFHAGPAKLGELTLARALVQAVSSPLGGLAGGFFMCINLSKARLL